MPIFPRYSGPPLMAQVCSVENLTLAWRRVRSNIELKRRSVSAGPDLVTLRDFEADWSRQMAQLADELASGAYRPVSPRWIEVPKKDGRARAIAILTVRDRVAQRAVHQVLDPLFEPLFLDCSYGCRPLIGVPEAIGRVQRFAAQGLMTVVDADIAHYFDHIDQRILVSLVRQRVDERPLISLIVQWLEAGSLSTRDSEAEPADLLGRGRQVVREFLNPERSLPPVPSGDPYAAAAWEAAGIEPSPPVGGWPAPAASLEQRLWTVLSVSQPLLAGSRRVLPLVHKLGGHPAVLAGAAAAGAVAAGGAALYRWRSARGRGTSQGAPLSPLLANIYLHPFDLALSSHGFRLVRYLDDFVIMCADEVEACAALKLAERQLAALRLTLNQEKTSVRSYSDGLEFLGEVLAPRQSGLRFEAGLSSFAEAEQALRAVARKVRRKR